MRSKSFGYLRLESAAPSGRIEIQPNLLREPSDVQALTEAVEFGASDYLLKPIDQEDLVSLLSQQYVRCARWQSAVLGTLEAAVG